MRLFETDDTLTVTVSADEVRLFCRVSWPGAKLPAVPVALTYDRATEELIDIRSTGRFGGPALIALADRALLYARQRLEDPRPPSWKDRRHAKSR